MEESEEGGEEEADEEEMRSEAQSGVMGCSEEDTPRWSGGDAGELGFETVHTIVFPGPAPGMSPMMSGGAEADHAAAARVLFADRSRHWSTEFSESRSRPDEEVELLELDLLPTTLPWLACGWPGTRLPFVSPLCWPLRPLWALPLKIRGGEPPFTMRGGELPADAFFLSLPTTGALPFRPPPGLPPPTQPFVEVFRLFSFRSRNKLIFRPANFLSLSSSSQL